MTRTDSDFRSLAQQFFGLARRNLERHGCLAPVAFVCGHKGSLAVIVMTYRNDAEKQAAYAHVQRLARHAAALVFISDSWIVDADNLPGPRPAKHPNRHEALILELATASGVRECWKQGYTRAVDGIRWGEPQTFSDFTSSLLDPLTPTQH